MNPYQMLPLYDQSHLEAYNQYGVASPGPHVFGVAASTYRGLLDARSQSVIISGESGAGKTETAKRFLQFLAYAATQARARAAHRAHATPTPTPRRAHATPSAATYNPRLTQLAPVRPARLDRESATRLASECPPRTPCARARCRARARRMRVSRIV